MGCFDYHIPDRLLDILKIGCLVEVPFGSQVVQGIVIDLHDTPDVAQTKEVAELVDELPVLTCDQLKLATIISKMFLCSFTQAIDLLIPAGLSQQADILVTLTETPPEARLSPVERKITDILLRKRQLRGRQLDAALPRLDWRKPLRRMREIGAVDYRSILPKPTVRPQMVKTVQICVDAADVDEYKKASQNQRTTSAAERRFRVLDFLLTEAEPIPVQWVYAQTACNMSDLQNLSGVELVTLGETEWIRDPVAKIEALSEKTFTLTEDQERSLRAVEKSVEKSSMGNKTEPILLHGVTGSGKTEIYLRGAERVVALGKKVIILVPEIALTPQTVRRFINRFPGKVGLYHSKLSIGERYDTWRRARAGKIDVVVGARSALFLPLQDVGLIILDECHDDSYSQSDFGLYYDARVLAPKYAAMLNAVCIFGSATPNVTHLYESEKGGWDNLKLPTRIQTVSNSEKENESNIPAPVMGELPGVQIVDMREELKAGNRSILSVDLQKDLIRTFEAGQQAILYLNRRGKATYIFCRTCGYVVKCPRCDLPLTSHGEKNDIICHQCGYSRKIPGTCPECRSTAIRQLGVGTETVEAAVQKLLPDANILRWDAETTRFKDAHEIILSHFSNHRADILIGTQMITKGLDFPLVTLVGVILAETGLSLPDYRANERTFQLLTQVSGRAGRSDLGGKVIFQTYQPAHFVIDLASRHDYDGFYTRELDHRRRLGYPPFYQLVRLEITNQSEEKAKNQAEQTARKISEWIDEAGSRAIEVIGPVPCFFGRINNIYRWQVIVRGPNPANLIQEHVSELTGIRMEVNPPNLL